MSPAAFLPSRKTLVLLAFAAGIIGGAVWWTRAPTEPVYAGRPLSEWLYQSHLNESRSFAMMPRGGGQGRLDLINLTPAILTRDQLEAMGPNAVVWLGYAVEYGRLSRPAGPRSGSSAASVDRIRELVRKWLHFRSDDTYDECQSAASLLFTLKQDAAPAIPALLRALGAADTRRADCAWRVLSAIGKPAHLPIREALVNGAKSTRRRILHELPYAPWYTKQQGTVAEYAENLRVVLAACGDPDAEIRGWAAITVAECSFTGGYVPAMDPAVRVLMARLSDADASHRLCAMSYLPLFGAKAAASAPRLVELLGDTEPAVRLEAVKALPRIQGIDPTLMFRFRQMLNDPDPSVRAAVRSCLDRSGGQKPD